jgi:hypothetical protein
LATWPTSGNARWEPAIISLSVATMSMIFLRVAIAIASSRSNAIERFGSGNLERRVVDEVGPQQEFAAAGPAFGYFYFEDEPQRQTSTKRLSRNDARRIGGELRLAAGEKTGRWWSDARQRSAQGATTKP